MNSRSSSHPKKTMKNADFEYIPMDKLHVLIISKPFDPDCQQLFVNIVNYLYANSSNDISSTGSSKSTITLYSNQYSIDSVKDID